MVELIVELYGDPDKKGPYYDEGALVASSGCSGGRTSRNSCPYLSMEGHARVHPPLRRGRSCIESDNIRALI